MVGRFLRVIGTVVVLVIASVTPALATARPAGADTVIDGCTIVSNPTPTNFTNCPGADLSGANLSTANLSYANLAGANLSNTALVGTSNIPSIADLLNANLSSANLTGANMFVCALGETGEICSGPILDGANLTHANLTNVALAGCPSTVQCAGVILSGADLSGATFTGATLAACLPPGASPPGCAGADLSQDNLSGVNLTGLNLSDVNLTGATLTGATLTGATLTGTVLVPSDQAVPATSNAGAVVTWPTPPSLPGATPGTCSPLSSGSTFPVGATTITCQVLDDQGNVATGTFTVRVVIPQVLIPPDGATLSGTAILDGAVTDPFSVKSFQYELTGGSYTNQVVATAKPTVYGWLAQESNGTWGWDSTSVPSGAYTLTAVVTYNDGKVVNSPGISVTVSNPAPTAQVLIPSGGATLSGTVLLDGTAPYTQNIHTFDYELNGSSTRYAPTPTIYGWALNWDSTSVPSGTYTLTAVVTYNDGVVVTSPGISVTVSNPPPTAQVSLPFSTTGTVISGGAFVGVAPSYPQNVTGVTIDLDGSAVGNAISSGLGGWVLNLDTTKFANGSHTLTAVVTYSDGVTITSPGLTVDVENP